MHQLVKGLHHIHSMKYLHLDMKPLNILVSQDENLLKIADLGCSLKVDPSELRNPGLITLWYRPPEMLVGKTNYAFEVDIWSLGCIFAEMCQLNILFQGQDETAQMIKIIDNLIIQRKLELPTELALPNSFLEYDKSQRLNFDDDFPHLSQQGKHLLRRMLEVNPSKRITVEECINHEFFKEHLEENEQLELGFMNTLLMQKQKEHEKYLYIKGEYIKYYDDKCKQLTNEMDQIKQSISELNIKRENKANQNNVNKKKRIQKIKQMKKD